MITHALTIIVNELTRHLALYGPSPVPPVELGNIAEGFRSSAGGTGVAREVLNLSVVNIKEEAALKNLPGYERDLVAGTVRYERPPVFLNLQLLLVATHASYAGALLMLSRAIRYFQLRPLFTDANVDPSSVSANAPLNPLDRLTTFKLALSLYSPTMEEVNHLWGTLGGKQYPFVMYMLRLVELRFDQVESESRLVAEVVRNMHPLPPAPS
jgi:hypothetical protein